MSLAKISPLISPFLGVPDSNWTLASEPRRHPNNFILTLRPGLLEPWCENVTCELNLSSRNGYMPAYFTVRLGGCTLRQLGEVYKADIVGSIDMSEDVIGGARMNDEREIQQVAETLGRLAVQLRSELQAAFQARGALELDDVICGQPLTRHWHVVDEAGNCIYKRGMPAYLINYHHGRKEWLVDLDAPRERHINRKLVIEVDPATGEIVRETATYDTIWVDPPPE